MSIHFKKYKGKYLKMLYYDLQIVEAIVLLNSGLQFAVRYDIIILKKNLSWEKRAENENYRYNLRI